MFVLPGVIIVGTRGRLPGEEVLIPNSSSRTFTSRSFGSPEMFLVLIASRSLGWSLYCRLLVCLDVPLSSSDFI